MMATDPTAVYEGGSLVAGLRAALPDATAAITHIAPQPTRSAQVTAWPAGASPDVVAALQATGVTAPWTHQAATADLAASGQHVVTCTGTASGKSLGYQLAVLTALQQDPHATALYIAPTKALAADQCRAATTLTRAANLTGIHPLCYDGDTPGEVRRWARSAARWLFTNPDMLHLGILAGHRQWHRVLRHLRYVVVDECHSYRGVFGSHVALVLRRLRRLAARYDADPVFVLCSATTANPAAAATQLIGAPCVAVTEDGSPSGARTVALWRPVPTLAGVAPTANEEAARIMAQLVSQGAQTLTFVTSRQSAEVVALDTERRVRAADPALAGRVAAYRAGYLAEDRHTLLDSLGSGQLAGVASTTALELGVDITGLDAVVIAGYPGSIASFRQQAGRVGRRGQQSLVVFVARDDPLDAYLVQHPETLLDKAVEATVTDPANPFVLRGHLLCAAQEQPLTDEDLNTWGAGDVVAELAAEGLIRRRPQGRGPARWFATASESQHHTVDLRGIADPIAVVERESGRVVGTTDARRAAATLHPGAVHLHQGQTYLVDELDWDAAVALVHAEQPGWTTKARTTTALTVGAVTARLALPSVGDAQVTVALADVQVTRQVVDYLRILPSGEILDVVALALPPQTMPTRAVLFSFSEHLLTVAGVDLRRLPAALHALEHVVIAMLPLVASCDRWDVGGVSVAHHVDTATPTIFVYDNHSGGAGLAERGYAEVQTWLAAALEVVDQCGCRGGCPSCVQSPNCGSGNHPLDKAGAVRLLTVMLAELVHEKPTDR